MSSLAMLHMQLESDPMRASVPFSPDFAECQNQLLSAEDDAAREVLLGDWLADHQPCLFGKIAARVGMIEYCFLTAADLVETDEVVRDKIRAAHQAWWGRALLGEKSGFIVHASSEQLATARPGPGLLAFASRLATLYLERESISADQIQLDQVFLEIPDRPTHLFRWDAGVNVFAAAGDGRWWNDHRIPGGLAFSVNSVGHMVKAAQANSALETFRQTLDISEDNSIRNVDSLAKALKLAMLTIDNASDAISGRATWLISPDEAGYGDEPACPIELPRKIAGKSHCAYRGIYHTDVTLPSSYFQDSRSVPSSESAMLLDFTYLFDSSVDNPAHQTMGAGQQVRVDDGLVAPATDPHVGIKRSLQEPTVVLAADYPHLGRRHPLR